MGLSEHKLQYSKINFDKVRMEKILQTSAGKNLLADVKKFYSERQYIYAYNCIILFIRIFHNDYFKAVYKCKNLRKVEKIIHFPQMTNLDMLNLLAQYFLFRAYSETTYQQFIDHKVLYTMDNVLKALLYDWNEILNVQL